MYLKKNSVILKNDLETEWRNVSLREKTKIN